MRFLFKGFKRLFATLMIRELEIGEFVVTFFWCEEQVIRAQFPLTCDICSTYVLIEKSVMHRSILFLTNNFYFRICYVNVQWARCGWFIEHHERCSSLQKEQKCRYSTFGFTNLPQTAWWVVLPNLKYRLNFLVKS